MSWIERRQIADAILSHEVLHFPAGHSVVRETAPKPTFSERWSGSFNFPEPDPNDARLTYLLNRFSA